MGKKFSGFTGEQTEVLARKMGYQGPMDKFSDFLSSSPDYTNRFEGFKSKAQSMLEAPQMATGGLVQGTKLRFTTPNTRGKELSQQMINRPNSLITKVNTTKLVANPNQMVDPNSGQVGAASEATAGQGTATTAEDPNATAANTVTASTVTPQVDQTLAGVNAAQGTVSANSQVTAQTAQPSANATVQGQLASLMQQFEGGETPAWAAGALRKADAMMMSRGLGASSMAAAASTQAMMESALEIAVRDASTYSTFEQKNLDNRQQAALVNAQSFLAMDMANLDNEQQTTLFKAQARIQSLFSDQAAENAASQFNATSKNQTDQFFAGLKSTVQQFNAAQSNAMSQFNTSEANATSQFNATVRNQRDQFNAANRLIVDQSNAQWRRDIATTNNATINEANRINAQSATGMTMAAYNNLMQRERDFYSFAFTASQNAKDRANQLMLAQMQADAAGDAAWGEALGSVVAAGADAVINKLFS